NPRLYVVAVEPKSSAVLSGRPPGPHKIQGIGAGFVPDVLNLDVIDEVMPVDDEDAIATAQLSSRVEGVLAGISAGAALWAAIQLGIRPEWSGKRIVAILPDSGARYVSLPFFAPRRPSTSEACCVRCRGSRRARRSGRRPRPIWRPRESGA